MNTCEYKLWVRIMKEKYIKGGNFFTAPTPQHSSWGWRSILRSRSTIELGAAWRVGIGYSLSFLSDWWVGDKSLGLLDSVNIPDDLAHAKDVLPSDEVDKIRIMHTRTSFASGPALNFSQWLKRNCSSVDMINGIPWGLTFSYTCWELWKSRNRRIFDRVRPSPLEIVRRAEFTARESLRCGHQRNPEPSGRMRWVLWSCPSQYGWIKINTDGALKKNTGLASAGGLARDHLGDWLFGFVTKIGFTNSFAAELWGLREGLRLAKAKGFRRVVMELDSKSVVTLVSGDLEDHGCYSSLVKDCRFLLGSFEQIILQHILREGNRCADHLANLGQLGEWGTVLLDSPPASIEVLLAADVAGANSIRVW
nr:reverse transcriptase [Ipomoea batatas]